MPYTSHGHPYGLVDEGAPRPRMVARCGGPGLCRTCAREAEANPVGVPGFEGSQGPGKGSYGKPHVYARDVQSGAGNCVCGRTLGHRLHTEAAPGVPVPEWARP